MNIPSRFVLLLTAALLAPAVSWAQNASSGSAASPPTVFLAKPYLQWGDLPAGQLAVQWQTGDSDAGWAVQVQSGAEGQWHDAAPPAVRRVAVPGIAPHRVFRATLPALPAGSPFAYRLKREGEPVFSAHARAPKRADQPYRFVVFGDCAAGTPGQKAVAYQAYVARPDFVFITGDIVYSHGRISEYRDKFFPVYNADEASPGLGAPLLRSTLFLAAPGNHDIATTNLGLYPDALAYFLYWSQPLNGPLTTPGARFTPVLRGPQVNKQAFLAAAGSAYPRMANFSFDYGNAHWTVLDANPYVDWTDPAVRDWLIADLAAAQAATWRFVAFHHPGFNSSRKHFDEQRMRLLAEVFEQARVDVVFSGHVHNYQRSYPLRFTAAAGADGKGLLSRGHVDGRWVLDRQFDGKTHTRPAGIIYLVTGAGGANLYNPEQETDRSSWQEFTDKFVSKVHSMTLVDISGPKLAVRQVSATGEEVDRFEVTK